MTGAESAGLHEDPAAADAHNRVDLAIPARPDLLFLARMTAAAVASRAEFGYDQIEDLRLAIDELCLTLLEGRSVGGRMRLQFSWTDDTIEVSATVDETPQRGPRSHDRLVATPKPNELSERILDALVDEHGFDHQNGTSISWLRVKRADDGDP